MTENKFSKYLLYAIGEIILVVIGILIALQINNWNSNNNRKLDENQALTNINRDFEYNQNKLDTLLVEIDFLIDQNLEILKYTGGQSKPKTEDDFSRILIHAAGTPRFFPQNGYLDDLISSGRFSIINDDQLRNKLSSWKPILDFIKVRETLLENDTQTIIDYIIKNGSWLEIDELASNSFKYPKSGFDIDNRKMLLDFQFENMIENHINYLLLLKKSLFQAQKLNEEIIVLIKK